MRQAYKSLLCFVMGMQYMKHHALALGLSRALCCAALLPATTFAQQAAPDGASTDPKQLDAVVVQGEITYRDRTNDIGPVLSYDLEYFRFIAGYRGAFHGCRYA